MERYRFYSDSSVYFVTFSIVQWLPVSVSESACKIVTDSLNFCHHKKGLRINAYVIMPTHFHAILFHESFDAHQLEKVVTDFRKFTGRQLCDHCERHTPACFSATLRHEAGNDRERRFWRPSRHPEQIETEAFWQTKFDYLHENPCRKGLVVRASDNGGSRRASYWLKFTEGSGDHTDVVDVRGDLMVTPKLCCALLLCGSPDPAPRSDRRSPRIATRFANPGDLRSTVSARS